MKECSFACNFKFVDEVTRLVKREFHVDINESGANDITQLLIINKELENLFKYNKRTLQSSVGDTVHETHTTVVHDRCLLDGLVYTEYFYTKSLVSQAVWLQALQYWHKFHSKYDIIFYPNPHEIDLQDDGERSTNKEFRDAIIDKYENYYLNQFEWENKIVKLNGTVEQRMDTIVKTIDFYCNAPIINQ